MICPHTVVNQPHTASEIGVYVKLNEKGARTNSCFYELYLKNGNREHLKHNQNTEVVAMCEAKTCQKKHCKKKTKNNATVIKCNLCSNHEGWE